MSKITVRGFDVVIFDGRRRGATRSLKSNAHGQRSVTLLSGCIILNVLYYNL